MDGKHGRTTSGVTCHHRLWTAPTVERCQAWYDITALRRQTRSNDVWRFMSSSPLGSTHGRTTLGVAYIIAFGLADTVGRRMAWHAIIALGRETRSNNIERGMPSPPLYSTFSRTTSGVACHLAFGKHTRSNDVGRGMTSPPLDSTDNRQCRACHDITTIGQHTVIRRRAWHNISALEKHTRLDYVRRGMTSPPLYSTQSRTSSGVACHHRLWTS